MDEGHSTYRFEAEGAVVKPAYGMLVAAGVVAALSVFVLAGGELLAIVGTTIAALMFATAILQKPRKRHKARIRVGESAIFAGNERLRSLADVTGLSVVPWGSQRLLRLTFRGAKPLEVVVDHDAHVAELRTAIGLSLARSASQSFSGHAPFGCFGALLVFGISFAIITWVATRVGLQNLLLVGTLFPALFVAVPLLLSRLKSMTVTCGDEGLHVKSILGQKLIAYADIADMKRQGALALALVTKSGKRHAIELGASEDVHRLFEHIQHRASLPAADGDRDVGTMLARGDRAVGAWLGAIRSQVAPSGENYRQMNIPDDRLWAVLEDPAAEPTARIGAAVALRSKLGPEAQRRVRVAAGTTAFPEVRVALEAVAGAEDDAALERTVARAIVR